MEIENNNGGDTPSTNPFGRRLSGWKEISEHLGVAERTAQLWNQQGLPVQRLEGKRGRVFANEGELEAWLKARTRRKEIGNATATNRKILILAAFGSLLVLGLGLMVRFVYFRLTPNMGALAASHPTALTSMPIVEFGPDLSRQGLLAFIAQYPDSPKLMIQTGKKDPEVLLHQSSAWGFPRWSPNGRTIICPRDSEKGVDLVLVSLEGLPPRKLTTLTGLDRKSDLINNLMVSWHPDGANFVFSDRESQADPFRLTKLSLMADRKYITSPPTDTVGDVQPSVSPDGTVVAFARYASFSEADLYLVNLSSGVERRLTRDLIAVNGIAWLNGHKLVWSSSRLGRASSLWSIDINNNSISSFLGVEGNARFPSTNGRQLVYQFGTRDTNNHCRDQNHTRMVADSSANEESPAISPDGNRLAFVSRRTGSPEIWLSGIDGSGATQLTSIGTGFTDRPRWSPDGTHLAFTAVNNGNRDVMIVRIADRSVWSLSDHPSEDGRPAWSADGVFVYYRSNRSGKNQIWRQHLAAKRAMLITKNGGYEPIAVEGGVYYIRDRNEPGVWKTGLEGGDEQRVMDRGSEGRWAVYNGFIFTLESRQIFSWAPPHFSPVPFLSIPGQSPLTSGFSARPPYFCWTQVDQDTSDIFVSELNLESPF